ncbi:MAG TPA: hypothetical protein VFU81_19455, partial [Thermomicrobiales bacterium]|nr:hypothetical protein [Thermomicrobiales bacterium]
MSFQIGIVGACRRLCRVLQASAKWGAKATGFLRFDAVVMARVAPVRRRRRPFVATAFPVEAALRNDRRPRIGPLEAAMLRNVLLGLVLLPTLATAATPAGRWQGIVDIPGRPLALVVDIAQDGDGRWIGSVIVPALGVKGAPLANVTRVEDGVAFDLGR